MNELLTPSVSSFNHQAAMSPEFKARLNAKLAAYQEWIQGKEVMDCRLVQYCGVELTGAKDIPLERVCEEIEGLVCEAFAVDWEQFGTRVLLRVYEADGPVPAWEKVRAEEDLIDIDAMLREAGIAPNA